MKWILIFFGLVIWMFSNSFKTEKVKGISRYVAACKIIKRHEGFSNKAYWDYGRYSIGWGTKGRKGEWISGSEAQLRFKAYMEGVTKDVDKLGVVDPILYGCLCDLRYNYGHIPKEIKKNVKNKAKVANLFPKFDKGIKSVKKRRIFCQKLLLNEIEIGEL